ncbi:hypothetical protein J1N35_023036 [Gossypium stocksii]|uniref:Pentacotripeptide-repeat region of PRORP domain-containing protein n=1 Tax=Gossypium stocksii TaxID=47602 RepID=A0A9D4A3I1_9ROSI|nr:hypothetical protein J1N35_023036 [Gossypium stocksii]
MLKGDLKPTILTYCAFFCILRNKEEVFELFEKMKQMGCQPTNDTYIMMIESLVNGATLIMSSGQKMVDFKSNQLQNNQLDNQIRVETSNLIRERFSQAT